MRSLGEKTSVGSDKKWTDRGIRSVILKILRPWRWDMCGGWESPRLREETKNVQVVSNDESRDGDEVG